jgi:predicted methyltransferase
MQARSISLALLITIASLATPAAQNTSHDHRRDEWQKVDEIFAAMDIKPGAVVADVGAGGGYFTTRLARAVGEAGRVYAVDVSADVVRRLKERVAKDSLANVEVVHGATDDPRLPPATLDAALIVNAYHEMNEHRSMLAKLKAALKPNGRLVIVEPISPARRTRPRGEQTRNHEIGIDFVIQDAREAGFAQLRAQDPFTKRSDGHGDEEWLLVLTHSEEVTKETKDTKTDTKVDDWQSPALRITAEDFKRLPADQVLVLDVRDPQSYRQGHLPNAVLMTPEEIAKPETAERLAQEKRRIITYCS